MKFLDRKKNYWNIFFFEFGGGYDFLTSTVSLCFHKIVEVPKIGKKIKFQLFKTKSSFIAKFVRNLFFITGHIDWIISIIMS